jgi:tRNA(His) 5'-end guanylyltransferase
MESMHSDWNRMRCESEFFVVSLKSRSLLKMLKQNTHDFNKKNEELGQNNIILKQVCKTLYDKYDPVMIYCFNNEINLVFVNEGNTLYKGNISKMVCKMASHASVCYSRELKNDVDITFEGIFVEFRKSCEVLNYLVWRQFDCRRNTVTSLYKCFAKNVTIENMPIHDMERCFELPKDLLYGIVMKKCMVAYTKGSENRVLVRKRIVADHFYLADNFDKIVEKYVRTKFLCSSSFGVV